MAEKTAGGAGAYGFKTTGTPQDPREAALPGLGVADTTTVQGNRLAPTQAAQDFATKWAANAQGLTSGLGAWPSREAAFGGYPSAPGLQMGMGGWPDSGVPGWGDTGSVPAGAAALAGALAGDPMAAPALSTFGTAWNAWGGGVPPGASRRAPSIVGAEWPEDQPPPEMPSGAPVGYAGGYLGMSLGNAGQGLGLGASASGEVGRGQIAVGAPGFAPQAIAARQMTRLPATAAPHVLGYAPQGTPGPANWAPALAPLGAFGNTNAGPLGHLGLGGWSTGPSNAGGFSFGGPNDHGSINGQTDRSLH